MKKISKKISCTLVLLAILVSSFSMGFESKAGVPEFYVSYPEPAKSESQGYLTLLLYHNSGYYDVTTFFWNTIASANGTESPCYMWIEMDSNTASFAPGGTSGATGYYYNLIEITTGEVYVQRKSSSSERYYYTVSHAGWTIAGWKAGGNVGYINSSVIPDVSNFTVNFNQDGSAVLLQGIISALLDIRGLDSSILSTVTNILNSVDGVENQLSALTTYLRGAIGQLDTKLASLLDKADRLIQEQEESNTWLEKIWTSIQRLFKGDSVEDDAKVEEFGDATTTQSNKINDLNQQNKTEKVDVDEASSEIDANIDEQAIANYGTVLSVFTGNTHILQYILIVLAVALIAYVLFGKR